MNVVPFGDHLRADKQIQFAGVQRRECALKVSMAAHSVAVEPRNSCLREESMQQLFQFFRACSEKIDILAAAGRAVLRHWSHESTVVALHPPLRLMVRQCDGTVLALERFAA